MPVWIPLAKTVLPYLASVVTSAIPAFAARKDHAKSLEAHSDQISELQATATQNAASVKTLAEQLEKTVKAVDEMSERHSQMRALGIASLTVAVFAVCVAVVALFRHP